MQGPIILLKEGSDSTEGKTQLVSNINACQAIGSTIATTLGPRGMDKLIIDASGKATISNDGATILKLLNVIHPAAKILVDIAKSQDAEVGDGTTSVVLLTCEYLNQAKSFVEDGVHPQIIMKSYKKATLMALEKLNELSVTIKKDNPKEFTEILTNLACTALSSKILAQSKRYFAEMVVQAVQMLQEPLMPLDMIGIKKVQGGSLEESMLIAGVAFKKTFSYAGFEMQPKKYTKDVKIAALNIELELKSEKENAEIRVDNAQEYQAIIDAEWTILYEKLENIHKSGAKVVLSKLPIGDVATQYFADRDLFCAGRVVEEDMKRTIKACGGSILTSVTNITPENLGTCQLFEEKQIGNERFNVLTGCPKARTCTIILRGAAEQLMDESERSIHDAIMVVRRAITSNQIVAGGGAVELELSKYLRDYSRTITGKEQALFEGLAKALEIIPRQLCDNAGLDPTNFMNALRQKHAQGEKWFGLNVNQSPTDNSDKDGSIRDNMMAYVWEPRSVKSNALSAALEATNLILSIDQTMRMPKAGQGMGSGAGAAQAMGMM
ncbi:unnamed protein product [Gordionus sp. m RMFG-2023]|uniref:T-complex protein 1 subunit eta-like n=1 Tax=Gordionus sp. m RMFG-2023 TaxID=3053472 RepID=UPI0030DF6C4B